MTGGLELSRLSVGDIPQCLRLIDMTMPDSVYADAVKALSDPKYRKARVLFGVFDGDWLVGFSGYILWRGRYYVSWTAVDPAHQGKGIGTRVIERTLRRVRGLGATHIDVETYEHPMFFKAIGFYLKHGFRLHRVYRGKGPEGSTMLIMRRKF